MTTRCCSMCKGEFPATLEHFYAHPGGKYGLNNVCKACQKAKARASEKARKDSPEFKRREAEKSREYHQRNPEQARLRCQQWRQRNPSAAKVHQKLRRKRLNNGSYSPAEWEAKVALYEGRCHWCKQTVTDGLVVDHLVPVSRGGRNVIENVVPSCHPCNQSKHKALPEEFLARRPDLRALHI